METHSQITHRGTVFVVGEKDLPPEFESIPSNTGSLREGRRVHLVSDLDGTWLPSPGDEAALHRLETYLAHCPGVTLTFATGRTLESALEVLRARTRLHPDHLVTDVGAALHHAGPGESWIEDVDFTAWIAARWNPETRARVEQAGLPEGVRFQEGLNPLRRLALEVVDPRNLEGAAAELQLNLATLGLSAEILLSGGRYIDVLPIGVDKGSALEFMERCRMVPRPLITCGDSENDLGLFRTADLALLMCDSCLDPRDIPLASGPVVRTAKPGPDGILERLLAWKG